MLGGIPIRATIRAAMTAALVLNCALAAGAADLPTLDEVVAGLPRYDLSGTVVGKDGAPVRKAEVFLYYQRNDRGLRNRFVGKTKTNRKGQFAFKQAVVWEPITERENRFGGRYAVLAKHKGHGINFRMVLEDDRGEAADAYTNIIIPMREPVTCKAIVKDIEGNRLEGVPVYLCGARLPEDEWVDDNRARQYLRLNEDIGISSGVTDKMGRVELLAPGDSCYFWIEKDGFVRGWLPTSRGGRVSTLHASARLSGTVTLEDGSPAPGAAVWIDYDGNSLSWEDVTVADEDGRYVFENAPGDEFALTRQNPSVAKGHVGATTVTAEDLRPDGTLMGKSRLVKTKGGEEKKVNLKLVPGATISGRVVHVTTDEPVPNIQIDVYKTIPGRQYLDTQRIATDESGRFSVTVAPGSDIQLQYQRAEDGSYIIDKDWKQRNHNAAAWKGVVSESIKDLDLEIMTWPVQPLIGQVVDAAGKGVASATVWMHSEIAGITTDEDGTFTLDVAPTDRDFDLFAVSESEAEAGLLHVKAGATEAVIALEPTRTYDGEVTNFAGLPANNLAFHMDLHLNDSNIYRVRREPVTDDEGRFTAENLCPKAAFYAWWSADNDQNRDYSYGNADIDLTELEPGAPIRFQARQFLNAVMGKVVDADGNPIEGAHIALGGYGMRPQDVRNERVESDEAGEFTMSRLAYGDVTLVVSAEGFNGRRIKTASDAFDLVVALRPNSEPPVLDVTVRDEAGDPVADAPVTVRWEKNSEGKSSVITDEFRTNAEGRARLVRQSREDERLGRGVAVCDVPGYDLAVRGLREKTDDTIDLVLRKSNEPWSGTVTGTDGALLAGARITAYAVRSTDDRTGSQTAWFIEESPFVWETDEDGAFALERLGRQYAVSFRIEAEGYAKRECHFYEESSELPVFALSPGGRVRARIEVEDGTAIPLDLLIGQLVAPRSHGRFEATESGEYMADNVEPGQYDCMLSVRGDADEKYRAYVLKKRPQAVVESGQTTEVVFEFERGTAIRGTFIDPATGKTPEGRKYVYARGNDGTNFTARVRDDGTWSVYVPPGSYEIRYNDGEGKMKTEKTVEVRKGEPVEGIAIEMTKEDWSIAANARIMVATLEDGSCESGDWWRWP
ncbi:MAG: hypothetical protein GY851_19985 [bacterium]|nr:hypothetical protein [bacterium]